ncbi:MAG: hypothetical protein J0H39_13970 [Alphaproteobacteria bacterium]|nr:hypothetical protein [Alphaproteobacteria bacterium]
MSGKNQFPSVPDRTPGDDGPALARWISLAARAINSAMRGQVNAVHRAADADFTLADNADSTVLVDERLGYYSWVGFMPMTANAAAEIGAGTLYVEASDMKAGQLTVRHANNSQTDRTFRAVIIG